MDVEVDSYKIDVEEIFIYEVGNMKKPINLYIGVVLTTIVATSLVYVLTYYSNSKEIALSTPFQKVFAKSAKSEKFLTPDEKTNIKVYKEGSPSVVNITSIALSYDFFYQVVPQTGSGSGVIINPKGIIVTNNHVVDNATKLVVTLLDGSEYPAKVLGVDLNNDLAVLKIDVPDNVTLDSIEFGNSDTLEVGQRVYAIGNPFGLQSTLTTGIISSLSRTLKSENGRIIKDIIQTDAAINPGNSGGALLDTSGNLIGINTAIFSPKAVGNVGIGFAIPINTVEKITDDLIKYGFVKRPYLGLSHMLPLNSQLSSILKSPKASGLLVQNMLPGSPMEKAGIRPGNQIVRIGRYKLLVGGDIIYAYNSKEVKSIPELLALVESAGIGDKIVLTVIRDGKLKNIEIILEEKPRN